MVIKAIPPPLALNFVTVVNMSIHFINDKYVESDDLFYRISNLDSYETNCMNSCKFINSQFWNL